MNNPLPPPDIDLKEVAKFDKLANQWWDLKGELKTLHRINPVRLAFIQKYIPLLPPVNNLKILDVGCGGGILTESLSRINEEREVSVTGIDASPLALEIAKQHAQETGLSIDYQEITAQAMADEHPGVFDILTCMELLEHVPDPAAVISSCAKLVKPGGLILFSTINRTLQAYSLAILTAEYILKLLPKGTHQYEKFIKPSELDSWARAAGLNRVSLTGMRYNPLTDRASLGTDVSVNFLACYIAP